MKAERPPRGLMPLMACAGVALQFSGSLPYSTVALVIWLLALGAFYPAVLKRMWMPRFWIVTLLIALGSGLLLGERSEVLGPVAISLSGLNAGALMIVRGAFIFAMVGWASKALAHSGLHRLAYRLGARNLVASTSVAMDLLPELAGRVQRVRCERRNFNRAGRWKSTYIAAVNLLADCAMMADEMVKDSSGPFVLVITGPLGSGKTSTARKLAQGLKKNGVSVGGVIQPRHEDGLSYLLEDVATGKRWNFASFDPQHAEGITGYRFDEQAWAIAGTRLKWAADHMDAVLVDELGLLEAEACGHWPAFRDGFDSGSARLWILVVREDRLKLLAPRIGHVDRTIRVGSNTDTEDLLSDLLGVIENKNPKRTES